MYCRRGDCECGELEAADPAIPVPVMPAHCYVLLLDGLQSTLHIIHYTMSAYSTPTVICGKIGPPPWLYYQSTPCAAPMKDHRSPVVCEGGARLGDGCIIHGGNVLAGQEQNIILLMVSLPTRGMLYSIWE